MKDKLYVIKKYVKAPSAAMAIRREKALPVDDCWVDDDWRKNDKDNLADAIGFRHI
jgi:hypothetical protein